MNVKVAMSSSLRGEWLFLKELPMALSFFIMAYGLLHNMAKRSKILFGVRATLVSKKRKTKRRDAIFGHEEVSREGKRGIFQFYPMSTVSLEPHRGPGAGVGDMVS